MKQIVIQKDNSSKEFLYEQLYTGIKNQILSGDIQAGEKCPSIRNLARDTGVSVTTVMEAYNQLTSEGYIINRPGSGYYAEKVEGAIKIEEDNNAQMSNYIQNNDSATSEYVYDSEAFDFIKWKKCASKVFTEYAETLLYGSDLKGEYLLRVEIAKYLFRSRGVHTNPENIIIAAGTQQIAYHLGRMLKKKGVNMIAMETPGYTPVKSMFSDAGFNIADIPVTQLGIDISMLPANILSAVYVNPSNQFPTGVVMPAARRYEILEWAKNNNSYVIEDDYNSELRYFGKPLPTIKSLDTNDCVIYLGSFSSTLFQAIKISYMVLPNDLTEIFNSITKNYSQTCSKAEQLTLACYMSEGYYYTAIRKKRQLFTKKLKEVEDAFDKLGSENIKLVNTNSGLFVTVRVRTKVSADELLDVAKSLKIYARNIEELSNDEEKFISLYYSFIPLGTIPLLLNILLNRWKNL